jgi:hypothetical protein
MMLQTTLKTHTHKCEACAKSGKEVIWVHLDADRGQVAAHKCPECGTVNWKQCVLENAKLPQPQPRNNQGTNFETVLGYVLLFVGFALLGYGAFLYIKDWREKKSLPLNV